MKRQWDASEEASTTSQDGDPKGFHDDRGYSRKIVALSFDSSHQQQNNNMRSISPPPLTRKRTSLGGLKPDNQSYRLSKLPARPLLDLGEMKRGYDTWSSSIVLLRIEKLLTAAAQFCYLSYSKWIRELS
jgi:hypothetical protein